MLSLRVLGPVSLLQDDQLLPLPTHKAQALLLLALGGLGHRARLASWLWPLADDSASRRNLRRELARLRDAGAGDALRSQGEVLALSPAVQCDALAFAALADGGRAAEALALWRSPLADGLQTGATEAFDDWLAHQRQRLAGRRRQLLAAEAAAAEAAGNLPRALDTVQQLLADDPLQEQLHRQAMRLHAAAGDRSAAMAQHARCRDALVRELGLAPGAETEQLAARIRAGLGVASTAVAAPPAAQAGGTAWPVGEIRVQRPEWPSAEAAARQQALQQAAGACELRLAPLDGDGVSALVNRLSGAGDPRRFAQRLERATGGNPFFLGETLRQWRGLGLLGQGPDGVWQTPFDDATQDDAELPVPDSVRDTVIARVQRQPEAVRRVLEAAGQDSADIARHWEAGGEPARAVAHRLTAAEAALALYADADAQAHWQAALDDQPTLAQRVRILGQRWQILGHRGDQPGLLAAVQALDAARDAARTGAGAEALALDAEVHAAEILAHSQRNDDALARIQACLAHPALGTVARARALRVQSQVLSRLGRAGGRLRPGRDAAHGRPAAGGGQQPGQQPHQPRRSGAGDPGDPRGAGAGTALHHAGHAGVLPGHPGAGPCPDGRTGHRARSGRRGAGPRHRAGRDPHPGRLPADDPGPAQRVGRPGPRAAPAGGDGRPPAGRPGLLRRQGGAGTGRPCAAAGPARRRPRPPGGRGRCGGAAHPARPRRRPPAPGRAGPGRRRRCRRAGLAGAAGRPGALHRVAGAATRRQARLAGSLGRWQALLPALDAP